MRNKSVEHTRNIRGGKVNATTDTYRDIIGDYLREHWSPLKCATKLLARTLGTSPRSVENWFAGEAAPNGETLITMMARDPRLLEIIVAQVERRRCEAGPILSSSEHVALDIPAD